MKGSLSAALAQLARQSFAGGNYWHGPLTTMVESLTAEQALWRPAPERKCIWEIVRHITFWREYLLAHVQGKPTPDPEANNWSLPEPADDEAWRADLQRLRAVQEELVRWFEQRDDEALLRQDGESGYEQFLMEAGVLLHDSYHMGQIATLRALMGLPPVDPEGESEGENAPEEQE